LDLWSKSARRYEEEGRLTGGLLPDDEDARHVSNVAGGGRIVKALTGNLPMYPIAYYRRTGYSGRGLQRRYTHGFKH
jgi:hypothetical protein